MAIKIYEQFAPFANPADGDYPQGSFKNDSIPGAEDGTPLDAVWANDYAGFDAELFAQAGVVPNGQPDKLGASQRVDAMQKLHVNDESQKYTFDTVAAYKASNLVFPVGKTIHLKDRRDNFDVVAGVAGANDMDIIANNAGTFSLSLQLGDVVSLVSLGADNTGVIGYSAFAARAIVIGTTVHFDKGTYNHDAIVPMLSDTHFTGNGDVEVINSIPTAAASYNQMFVATTAVTNVSSRGIKFSSTNVAFNAFGFQLQVTNLSLHDNETEGCGLVSTFKGAVNTDISKNRIHSPASEGVFNDYARPIQINCLFTGTGTEDLHITDNTVLGTWTHGIEVSGNDVQDELDPTVAKNINRVVISGNIVKALTRDFSAGAIWWSQAADISVMNNHCELYGDVGLDCEASRNVTVTGNTLKNNNKNLAMFGNSMDVIFSDNTCYNTDSGLTMFYAKPANHNGPSYTVDVRNTNIVLSDNIFHYTGTVTGIERLELGSGGTVTVKNNRLINTGILANYMSLTEIIIKDNELDYNDAGVGTVPITVAHSYVNGDTTVTPFKAIITGNIITHSNPGGFSPSIYYIDGDTVGASIDFDKYLTIQDNIIRGSTTKESIYMNIAATTTVSKVLNHKIVDNTLWGDIFYNVTGNRTLTRNIDRNTNINGAPFSQTRTNAGILNTFEASFLDTTAGLMTVSLADGDYDGQQKKITMSAFGGDATVTIASHRLGINLNATFSAVGQYALLQWNIDRWDTLSTTAAGI